MRRADDEQKQARIDEFVKLRLDGAAFWNLRTYVRKAEKEKREPWVIPDGESPLSDSQIRRYSQDADRAIARESRAQRPRLVQRHVAWRLELYRRCMRRRDYKAALAVLDSLAKLQDLFPSDAEKLREEAERLRRQLAKRQGAQGADAGAGQGATGGGDGGGPGPSAGPAPPDPG